MQNVKFENLGQLLDFLPPHQLEMTLHLRDLVLETVPGVKEKLSFNVPFYSLNRGICYIWPGAVSWGSKTWPGVEFGFNQGYLLADDARYLDRGNRKQVFNKRYASVSEIPDNLLRAYLLEAVEMDLLLLMEKRKK